MFGTNQIVIKQPKNIMQASSHGLVVKADG